METIKPIKAEEEYVKVSKEMENISHAKLNTPEGDRLELLPLMIYEYEQKYYKIEVLAPLEAFKCEF